MKPPTDVIKRYWYSISWDVEEIWALDLPTEDMPIAYLVWHLDIPLWPIGSDGYAVTPRQVVNNPQIHSEEFRRTLQAQTKFPIEVIEHRGKWMILDGVHRLLKLWVAGETSIRVRKVPKKFVTWL